MNEAAAVERRREPPVELPVGGADATLEGNVALDAGGTDAARARLQRPLTRWEETSF
jgi:hypothetical protein